MAVRQARENHAAIIQGIPKLSVHVVVVILAAVEGGILPPGPGWEPGVAPPFTLARSTGQDARLYGRQRCLPLPTSWGCTSVYQFLAPASKRGQTLRFTQPAPGLGPLLPGR